MSLFRKKREREAEGRREKIWRECDWHVNLEVAINIDNEEREYKARVPRARDFLDDRSIFELLFTHARTTRLLIKTKCHKRRSITTQYLCFTSHFFPTNLSRWKSNFSRDSKVYDVGETMECVFLRTRLRNCRKLKIFHRFLKFELFVYKFPNFSDFLQAKRFFLNLFGEKINELLIDREPEKGQLGKPFLTLNSCNSNFFTINSKFFAFPANKKIFYIFLYIYFIYMFI